MTGDQWYYRLRGRPYGPFTPAQFRKLASGGTITRETEVSADGRTWRPWRDVESGVLPDPTAASDSVLAPTRFAGGTAPPGEQAGPRPPA